MAEGVAEATSILPKDTVLVRLDDPMDSLDMTKMMAKEFETEKQKSEEPSLSGDEVEEADTACGCTFVIIRFRRLAREYRQFVHVVFCRFPCPGRGGNELFPRRDGRAVKGRLQRQCVPREPERQGGIQAVALGGEAGVRFQGPAIRRASEHRRTHGKQSPSQAHASSEARGQKTLRDRVGGISDPAGLDQGRRR